jgi:hypothetical protein
MVYTTPTTLNFVVQVKLVLPKRGSQKLILVIVLQSVRGFRNDHIFLQSQTTESGEYRYCTSRFVGW